MSKHLAMDWSRCAAPGPPRVFHPDGGLVHPPDEPDIPLTAAQHRGQGGAILQDQTGDGRMIDGDTAFLHEFFDMARA